LPQNDAVALVGGGEATLPLVADAPPGGRCQHAALQASRWLAAKPSDAVFAALASDGMDGSTDAAGAWTTAHEAGPEADAAAQAQDAHAYLQRKKRLVHMGPTGTNVNDLWVALRRP
jgi:glycerate 2-kinase